MDQMCQIFVQTISSKIKLIQGFSKFQKSGGATNTKLSIYDSVFFLLSFPLDSRKTKLLTTKTAEFSIKNRQF